MLRTVTFRLLAFAACVAVPAWPAGAQMSASAGDPVAVGAPADAAAADRPRLQLVPVDVGAEPAPLLHPTTELATTPAGEPAQREAASALWQVLQKSPEQGLQDALRLENAERELHSLRAVSQQDAAAVAHMRAQVERTAGERNLAAMLVAVLSVVLATILAALAWRWYRAARMARVNRWFEANAGPGATASAAMQPLDLGQREPVEPVLDAVPVPAPLEAATVAAAASAAEGALPVDDAGGHGGALRMVGVEELIDVHDQADFYLTIGKPQEAVAVLEAHIHDQVETSALAWMDLLDLYHRLGQRAEFERLRVEFRQNFTGEVPDFDHFDQPSASLEYYARALSRIVALWPSPRVLDVIEESIFRKPGLPGAEPFTLEAYRELLLLYHVASDIAGPDRQEASARYSDTALQPLNAMQLTERPAPDPDTRLVPPASPNVGLDIDLGADEAPHGGSPIDFDVSGSDAMERAPAAGRQS